MPYDRKTREAGQIAYYTAISNLKHTLSDQDIEYLYKQQPVGIDPKGRIILRSDSAIKEHSAHHSKLFGAVAKDLVKCDWASGLTFQFSSHSCEKYSPYKDLLYMPRYLVNMTLPHRKVGGNEFSRRNGGQELSLLAARSVGLPYGVYARLILLYLTTERVRRKEREFLLGASWRAFLEKMQINRDGEKNQAVQEQLRRLCATLFQIHDVSKNTESISNLVVADEWFRSEDGVNITLSPSFYLMTRDSIVPLESKIVHKLRRSPLMLDLYAWLSCRLFVLRKETIIPWRLLEHQFGSDYGRLIDFRRKFQKSLKTVLKQQPLAPQVEWRERGLHLSPGRPSDVEWMERQIARASSATRFPLLI